MGHTLFIGQHLHSSDFYHISNGWVNICVHWFNLFSPHPRSHICPHHVGICVHMLAPTGALGIILLFSLSPIVSQKSLWIIITVSMQLTQLTQLNPTQLTTLDVLVQFAHLASSRGHLAPSKILPLPCGLHPPPKTPVTLAI